MNSMLAETRESCMPGVSWDEPRHGQSWQCAVLWGSLVLEASPGLTTSYRFPGAPLTWTSTTLSVLLGRHRRRQVRRWVN